MSTRNVKINTKRTATAGAHHAGRQDEEDDANRDPHQESGSPRSPPWHHKRSIETDQPFQQDTKEREEEAVVAIVAHARGNKYTDAAVGIDRWENPGSQLSKRTKSKCPYGPVFHLSDTVP